MKVYSNALDHMTSMAAMPIYGKNFKKSSSLEPNSRWPRTLVCSIEYSSTTKFVQMMTLGWPWPVVAAFFLSTKTKRKRNGNETKTLHKRGFRHAFWVFSKRFDVKPMKWQKRFSIKCVSLSENVFRNVLTFSQWNGKNDFQLNAFFFPKTFVQSALTYRKTS